MKMNNGHTEAVFVHISLDEHPAFVRGLEQQIINWFQLLLLPQKVIVARLLIGRDHDFVQSEHSFISFYLFLQDLSEKVW